MLHSKIEDGEYGDSRRLDVDLGQPRGAIHDTNNQ